jgi:predicted RNA-binding protein Jag
MKSIMEEASSVAKAIEQAWQRANKPKEFSIKVFEESEKNFFGFTKKPAKIGLFIGVSDGKTPVHSRERATHSSVIRQPQVKKAAPIRQQTMASHPTPPSTARQVVNVWNDELSLFAEQWLSECLKRMFGTQPHLTKETSKEILKFQISSPLATSPEHQQLLCKSLAHLGMEALRNKFKQNFRSLRIFINVQ